MIFYLVVGFNGSVCAAEILKSEVDDHDDHFVIHLEMRIDADYDSVYETLLDFENLKYLNDSIKESELLESNDFVHLVRVRSEGCILFFCESIVDISTVTELGRGDIVSIVDPDKSDFKYGKVLWQVIDEDETTKIIYKADFVPDFWIPPLIGAYFFKHRLIEEAEKTINGIERIINGEDD